MGNAAISVLAPMMVGVGPDAARYVGGMLMAVGGISTAALVAVRARARVPFVRVRVAFVRACACLKLS